MSDEMTTRRAIEIVLSRVRMDTHAAQHLFAALDNEIRGTPVPVADDATMRAQLMRLRADAEGVDIKFPKVALLNRLHDIRQRVDGMLG